MIRKMIKLITRSKPIISSFELVIVILLLTSLLSTSSPIFRRGLGDTETSWTTKMMLSRACCFSMVFCLLPTTQALLEEKRCQWGAENDLANAPELSKKMASLFIKQIELIETIEDKTWDSGQQDGKAEN